MREPVLPFETDGCTLWPDGDQSHRSCCVRHDKRYWKGGSLKRRAAADRMLRKCITRYWQVHSRVPSGAPLCGFVVWLGVRIGGSPWLPVPWRWGYGHGRWLRYT